MWRCGNSGGMRAAASNRCSCRRIPMILTKSCSRTFCAVGTEAGVDLLKAKPSSVVAKRFVTVEDVGGTNCDGVVQKFLSGNGVLSSNLVLLEPKLLPSFRLSRPTISTLGCRHRTQVRSNANNVPGCCRFQLS
mmetsp:Transcript_6981/g.8041  ORF Transcript_6981/g.8041 Transcript_6981/m.8041 type:complete len:134 (-) Transcript_6981:250-651(-)